MAVQQMYRPSPFLSAGIVTAQDSLAVLHLKRDHLIPTILRAEDEQDEGYDEGKVTNTRFGSFPHTTLIDVPWGSQVRASVVDTGSRGRRAQGERGKKRKRDDGDQTAVDTVVIEEGNEGEMGQKAAVAAATGFVHILPPTPELWTASLPHRTQVVYTPDYSYILQRVRATPGTRIIEAGAGSGSFTHAAARAIFSGYPDKAGRGPGVRSQQQGYFGKVWSFEFHEQRVQKLKIEIEEHGLDGIVEITHRDVCQDGFSPSDGAENINANAIFLDLPAPWLALRHLTRKTVVGGKVGVHRTNNGNVPQSSGQEPVQSEMNTATATFQPQSLLDPTSSIHLCTFSPCIEQVHRTITALRHLGWVDVEMVELAAKRIEVRRERVGLQEEGLRGVNASPASVDEALTRLREVEGHSRHFHCEINPQEPQLAPETPNAASPSPVSQISKQQRLADIREALDTRKLYKEGRLVHRAEPELKTHTSYLVFAILPREWTEADELAAQRQLAVGIAVKDEVEKPMSNRQRKKAAKAKAGGNKGVEVEEGRKG